MNAVSDIQPWKRIVSAVTALLRDRFLMEAKAFVRAVRGLKAAALVLLFDLAHAMAATVQPSATKTRSTPPPPAAAGRRDRPIPKPETWRNPTITAYVFDPPSSGRRPSQASAARAVKSDQAKLDKALATLQAILSLCTDPERFARRLAKSILASDHVLIAAYVRAIADRARDIDRRNRRAFRALKGERRRDRRDTG